MFTVLRDRAGDERLHGAHHLHVPEVVDDVVTHRAGEHREVLGLEVGCAEDGLVLVDVGDDLVDLGLGVFEVAQRTGHRLVDDRHRAAAHQLLELHQPEVGLDAGGVAIHHEADRARGSEHRGLRVAHAEVGWRRRTRRPTNAGRPRAARSARAPRRSSPPRRGVGRAPEACAPRSRCSRRTDPCEPPCEPTSRRHDRSSAR